MATIKDVAQLANVSVATVSRVFNAPETVREKTKLAVQEAIDQLSYSPNFLGRNLRQLQTRRILVLLDSISNQFYSRVVRGIEETAREGGFTVMLCTVRGSKKILLEHMNMLQTKVVDGVIILCSDLAPAELLEFNKHYPLVCACEPIHDERMTSVCVDDFQAALDATNFLIEQGNRRIAILGFPDMGFESYSSSHRMRGYLSALEQNNIPFDPKLVLSDGYSYNSGRRAVKHLLAINPLPDALFCFADSSAIGVIKELDEQGVHVPEEISVMGFDNTAMSEVYIPSITTVSQPQYEIGAKAMELLLNKISGSPHEDSVFLKHKIVRRSSVKNNN